MVRIRRCQDHTRQVRTRQDHTLQVRTPQDRNPRDRTCMGRGDMKGDMRDCPGDKTPAPFMDTKTKVIKTTVIKTLVMVSRTRDP
jgi:hypothetical protein